MTENNPTLIEINAMGQSCPMPLLLLKKALKQNPSTDVHWLLKSSDVNSKVDIRRYCEIHQLQCELIEQGEQEFHYLISRSYH